MIKKKLGAKSRAGARAGTSAILIVFTICGQFDKLRWKINGSLWLGLPIVLSKHESERAKQSLVLDRPYFLY